VTPAFALPFLRDSLTTLVSIKYTAGLAGGAHSLEVCVQSHIGHSRQDFDKAASAWARKGRGQDVPVLGFCASTMCAGALLEGPDNSFIDTPNKQVSHGLLQSTT
jgi:hypothetical protein